MNKNLYATRDIKKGNRLHSNITNLKSEFKALITPDGFVSIDCSNSQPLLLVASGYDNAEFKRLAEEGKIYERLEELSGLDRKVVKQELLRLLFRRVKFHEGTKTDDKILYKNIIKEFTDLIKYLEKAKEKGHSALALELQRLESSVFVDTVYAEFLEKHPEEPVFCLHDSIICHEGFTGEVEAKIKNAFMEKFKLKV